MSEQGAVYYLGEGEPWKFPKLTDGAHSDVEGVLKAAKLIRGIFGGERQFVLVAVVPLPDGDPEVNEQAMADCAALMRWAEAQV